MVLPTSQRALPVAMTPLCARGLGRIWWWAVRFLHVRTVEVPTRELSLVYSPHDGQDELRRRTLCTRGTPLR